MTLVIWICFTTKVALTWPSATHCWKVCACFVSAVLLQLSLKDKGGKFKGPSLFCGLLKVLGSLAGGLNLVSYSNLFSCSKKLILFIWTLHFSERNATSRITIWTFWDSFWFHFIVHCFLFCLLFWHCRSYYLMV